MGVETEKYIRKPLYVDAVRVTPQNFDEIVTWCQGEVQTEEQPGSGTIKKFIKVRVHNPKNPRQTKAFIGDWILYTERGYKVYTNKAFRMAFDKVGETPELPAAAPVVAKTPSNIQLPKFYLDPNSDELTETQPFAAAKPLSFNELINIVRNELVGAELSEKPEQERSLYQTKQDGGLAEPMEHGASTGADPEFEGIRPQAARSLDDFSDDESVPGEPLAHEVPAEEERLAEEQPGRAAGPHETPQGEPHEYVQATPQAIADAVSGSKEIETGPRSPDGEALGGGPVPPEPQDEPVSEQPPDVAAAGKRVLTEQEQQQMGPDAVRELVRTGDVILEQDLAA